MFGKYIALGMAMLMAISMFPTTNAHSETGSYSTGTTWGISVTCSPDCGLEGLNIGGYRFTANGEAPIKATFTDASGGAVAYTVCQDTDGSSICGDVAGEPSIEGCGTWTDLEGFSADVDVIVFIRIADPGCDGIASSGEITIDYYHPEA